jgi:hypothetical protein
MAIQVAINRMLEEIFFMKALVSGTNFDGGFLGFSIVSFIDLGNSGDTIKVFFASLSICYPQNYTPFVDEPNDFKYLTGKMNVLLGDNSVSIKDQAWLCNNRRKIGMLTNE